MTEFEQSVIASLTVIIERLDALVEAGKPKQRKQAEDRSITLSTFMKQRDEAGLPHISPDHHVYTYADDAGIPTSFLEIAFHEFAEKYTKEGKKYKDWEKAFANSVRYNWFKLWWLNEANEYELTSQGRQADRLMKSKEVN